ncbi:MAG: alpha/beta fold hydrolase [Geodermatophilaceae bacterium]
MATPLRSVDVCGLRIAYRRAGAGEPLLLLHGAFSDSREWRRQLDCLSDTLDVIAVDCPGCGQSDDPPDGFTLQDFSDSLAGFLAVLGVRQPHVCGLSFGSMYALALYRPSCPPCMRTRPARGAGRGDGHLARRAATRIPHSDGGVLRRRPARRATTHQGSHLASVRGTRRRSPMDVAKDLHAQIRGSQLVVLPEVGHGINSEAPERFNAAAREFLSSP